MGFWSNYPNLDRMSIAKRTEALAETCLNALQTGTQIDLMLAMAEDAAEREEYEFTQAAKQAVKQFEKNPQLSLF